MTTWWEDALIWCRKVFVFCAAKKKTIIDQSMQAAENGHERVRKVFFCKETNINSRRLEGPCQETKGWTNEGRKRRVTRKECKRLQVSWRRKGYYSAENQFERFRGFLELISRFEFEFRRCEKYFLNDSNF